MWYNLSEILLYLSHQLLLMKPVKLIAARLMAATALYSFTLLPVVKSDDGAVVKIETGLTGDKPEGKDLSDKAALDFISTKMPANNNLIIT